MGIVLQMNVSIGIADGRDKGLTVDTEFELFVLSFSGIA
jgi:hypothetical protein